MKQLDEQLRFKILQLCSGHYLSANIPDDWYDLTKEEQNQFLRDNNWQPFDHYDSDYVGNCISSAATATQHFIEDLLNSI